jgi:hypothetical protein
MNQHHNTWGDLVAATTIVASFAGLLPYIAALLGICWYCLQFWESQTRRNWSARRRLVRLEKLEREHAKRAGELERLREALSKENLGG